MLTEDESLDRLLHRLDEAAKLQGQLQKADRFKVEAGSALAGDRQKLPGYPADHFVSRYLTSACDNLEALRRLMVDAKVFQPNAPFTLIRTAIELSAWAVWLLEPQSRTERIRRVVIVAYQEAKTAHQARQGDGDWFETIEALDLELEEVPERVAQLASFRANSEDILTAQHDKFTAALERVGLSGAKVPGCTITDCFKDLAANQPEALWCLSQWRLTSGMVHGRFWPRMTVNEWGEEVEQDQGDSFVSLTASYRSAYFSVTSAAFLMVKAVSLLDLRRSSHY